MNSLKKIQEKTGLGTWRFCGKIMKFWAFSEVIWPQKFFDLSAIFEKLV